MRPRQVPREPQPQVEGGEDVEKTGGRRRKIDQWRGGLQNQHMRKPSRDKWRDWEETGKGGNQPDMGKLGLAGEAGKVHGIAGRDQATLGTG